MPELDSCASSERACRLWAAQHSRGKRPAHWAPSRCLGCSSQPPPKPPIALPLATQVDHRYHRHRRGRALGGRPDSAEVLRLPAEKEEESSQGGKGEGLQGGIELFGRLHSMHCLGFASLMSGLVANSCSVRVPSVPSQTSSKQVGTDGTLVPRRPCWRRAR